MFVPLEELTNSKFNPLLEQCALAVLMLWAPGAQSTHMLVCDVTMYLPCPTSVIGLEDAQAESIKDAVRMKIKF